MTSVMSIANDSQPLALKSSSTRCRLVDFKADYCTDNVTLLKRGYIECDSLPEVVVISDILQVLLKMPEPTPFGSTT